MRYIIGGVLGALAGYAYYYFIGCVSGTCAITSNPMKSTIYFLVIGVLLSVFFEKKKIVTGSSEHQRREVEPK